MLSKTRESDFKLGIELLHQASRKTKGNLEVHMYFNWKEGEGKEGEEGEDGEK